MGRTRTTVQPRRLRTVLQQIQDGTIQFNQPLAALTDNPDPAMAADYANAAAFGEPLGAFTLCEHFEDGHTYYRVIDGVARLAALAMTFMPTALGRHGWPLSLLPFDHADGLQIAWGQPVQALPTAAMFSSVGFRRWADTVQATTAPDVGRAEHIIDDGHHVTTTLYETDLALLVVHGTDLGDPGARRLRATANTRFAPAHTRAAPGNARV